MPSAEDLAFKATVPANSAMTFKPGDRVQWMESYQRGSSLNISCKRGVVLSVNATNTASTVREDRSKRKKEIPLKKLRPERGLVGPVTELLFALAGQPVPEHLRSEAAAEVPRGTNPQ